MDPQQPLSVSYLDQIAPVQQPGMSNKVKIIFVIAAIIASVLAGWFALSTFNEPTVERNDLLQFRLVTLGDVADQAQSTLSDSDLRSANANLILFTTNSIGIYGEPETSQKDPSVAQTTEAANAEELSKTLEDARLNAMFDRVYQREILPQLYSVNEALNYLGSTTSNQEQKAAYQESADQLKIIVEDFTNANLLD